MSGDAEQREERSGRLVKLLRVLKLNGRIPKRKSRESAIQTKVGDGLIASAAPGLSSTSMR
jgi:hypothetical protein